MAGNMIVPLPGEVTGLLPGLADGGGLVGVHPGLTLDKYALSWDDGGATKGLSERVQRPVVDQVVRLSQAAPPGLDYAALFNRWQATVGTGAFAGTTAGPLTLHLARVSALENAGLCLHRVYGFAYLPGTGLKGLARAFAETVWLDSPEVTDKVAGWQTIEKVFGWAPGSDLIDGKPKAWKPAGVPKRGENDAARVGCVVFHDAWSKEWPKLVTDILNSHHSKYYSGDGPPGDWEDPVPVYFLSVEPGTTFHFPVAGRRSDTDPELVKQAREWLIGGLTQLGAGAKTASGYGDFEVKEPKVEPIASAKRPSFTATLELVTPAFLAGAKQQAEDCDLRPATLRGQLRWWWRTMHAGFVDVPTLRAMEAAVWGDTTQGGAVRVTVRPKTVVTPRPYSHPRQPPPSGVRYAAYGMDEQVNVDGQRVRKQRHVADPGATWEVRVSVRVPTGQAGQAGGILRQATAALWLLTRFGGVGSKSRKGFGSLHADAAGGDWPAALDECVAWAAAYRGGSGVPNFNTAVPGSLSDPDRQLVEIPVGRTDSWSLMERIGAAFGAVAAAFKHDDRKAAFGLPRKIHGPRPHPLPHQDPANHSPPLPLSSPVWPPRTNPEKGRHTSPIHLHVGKDAGGYVVRLFALPAVHLRTRAESAAMLGQFARGFAVEFGHLAPPAGAAPPPPRPVGPAPAVGRRDGTPVQVTVVKKLADAGGRPNFQVQEDGKKPGSLNLGTAPSPLPEVGAVIGVFVAADQPNNPSYRWTRPAPPPPPKPGGPRRK